MVVTWLGFQLFGALLYRDFRNVRYAVLLSRMRDLRRVIQRFPVLFELHVTHM